MSSGAGPPTGTYTLTVESGAGGEKTRTRTRIKNEKFKVSFKGSPDVEDDKRTVSGDFSGRKLTGTIKVEGLCSADVTYSAKR